MGVLLRITLMIMLALTFNCAKATNAHMPDGRADADKEHLQASIITCMPGPEVYELCGHSAIRIRGMEADGTPVDSVWNYGVFNFHAPNFVYRFVKGETDYMVMGYPFAWFLPEYEARGSEVVEQDLNLTREETATLRRMLQINSLPQNRVYRYNYVRDNCSTRIADIVSGAVSPKTVDFPDSVRFGTFRTAMRHYHQGYPWYQFGIDLALGAGIDMPINSREEMFVPMRLMENASAAHFNNEASTPLVKETRILVSGHEGGAKLPPTSFWLSPLFYAIAGLTISCLCCLNRKALRWCMAIYFGLCGLAGCLIWYLVFVSTHEATSPNLLALWLNPLELIVPFCIWGRRSRQAVTAMMVVNMVIMIVLCCCWPLQPQVANPAVFPLWATTLVLSFKFIYDRMLLPKSATRNEKPTKKSIPS